MKTTKKEIYLTFDDGPEPEVTPWVLEQLAKYNAKATFFVVGENVEQNPEIVGDIIAQEHSIGNHTYNHLNGWNTENLPYFLNIKKCAKLINSNLFRPPYGKLTPKQINFLHRHYEVIMWDVLSGDFDPSVSPQECTDNVIKHASEGSIVVFHDSQKAEKNVKVALPATLEYFSKLGYTFKAIPDFSETFKEVQRVTT